MIQSSATLGVVLGSFEFWGVVLLIAGTIVGFATRSGNRPGIYARFLYVGAAACFLVRIVS